MKTAKQGLEKLRNLAIQECLNNELEPSKDRVDEIVIHVCRMKIAQYKEMMELIDKPNLKAV